MNKILWHSGTPSIPNYRSTDRWSCWQLNSSRFYVHIFMFLYYTKFWTFKIQVFQTVSTEFTGSSLLFPPWRFLIITILHRGLCEKQFCGNTAKAERRKRYFSEPARQAAVCQPFYRCPLGKWDPPAGLHDAPSHCWLFRCRRKHIIPIRRSERWKP